MADPRIERTRATVLEAAAAIVVDGGPAALTIDAVVARSGVARSTIYRHWPTRDDLLVGVFQWCIPHFEPPPPELSFVEALRFFLRQVVGQMSEPTWARMFPSLLMLKTYEPSVADVEAAVEAQQLVVADELFARGAREGLLGAGFDRDRAMAGLVGPVLFALVLGRPRLDDELVEGVLASFLAGLAATR